MPSITQIKAYFEAIGSSKFFTEDGFQLSLRFNSLELASRYNLSLLDRVSLPVGNARVVGLWNSDLCIQFDNNLRIKLCSAYEIEQLQTQPNDNSVTGSIKSILPSFDFRKAFLNMHMVAHSSRIYNQEYIFETYSEQHTPNSLKELNTSLEEYEKRDRDSLTKQELEELRGLQNEHQFIIQRLDNIIQLFEIILRKELNDLQKAICKLRILQCKADQALLTSQQEPLEEIEDAISDILKIILNNREYDQLLAALLMQESLYLNPKHFSIVMEHLDKLPKNIISQLVINFTDPLFPFMEPEENKKLAINFYNLIFEQKLYRLSDAPFFDHAISAKNPALIFYFNKKQAVGFSPEAKLYKSFWESLTLPFQGIIDLIKQTNPKEDKLLELSEEEKKEDPHLNLALFKKAEATYFQAQYKDVISIKDLDSAEELYLKVHHKNKALFVLSKIRLLEIAVLKEGIKADVIAGLKRQKNALIPLLAELSEKKPNILFSFLFDKDIETQNHIIIIRKLWKEKENFSREELRLLLTRILSNHYAPSNTLNEFKNELQDLFNIQPALKTEEINNLINNYFGNAITAGQKFFKEKCYDHALAWYSFAIDTLPAAQDATLVAALHEISDCGKTTTPQGKQELIKIRLYLLNYFINSDHKDLNAAKKYFRIIAPNHLTEQQNIYFDQLKETLIAQEYTALHEKTTSIIQKLENLELQLEEPTEGHFACQIGMQLQKIVNQIDPAESKEQKLSKLKKRLKKLFHKIWGEMCVDNSVRMNYITDESAINKLLLQLTEQIDIENRMEILLPSVTTIEDVNCQNINQLAFGQFILTDNKENFITLATFFESIILRANKGEKDRALISYYDNNTNKDVLLSENEKNLIIYLIPEAANFFKLAEERLKSAELTALGAFQELRQGLREGDKLHGGNEMDAGKNANEAIINFNAWFSELSSEEQKQLKSLTARWMSTFGEILENLYKPIEKAKEGNLDVNLCVQTNGDKLDSIITVNTEVLRNFKKGRGNIKQEGLWTTSVDMIRNQLNAPSLHPKIQLPLDETLLNEPSFRLYKYHLFLFNEVSRLMFSRENILLKKYQELLTQAYNLKKTFLGLDNVEREKKVFQLEVSLFLTANTLSKTASLNSYCQTFDYQTMKFLISAIQKHHGFCKTKGAVDKKLKKPALGKIHFHFDNGALQVAMSVNNANHPIYQGSIEITPNNKNYPYSLMINNAKREFKNFNHAVTEIRLQHALLPSHPNLFALFKKLDDHINLPNNSTEFKESLLNLRTKLVDETFYALYKGKSSNDIINGDIGKTINEICPMIHTLQSNASQDQKLAAIKTCKNKLMPTSAGKIFGKVLLTVFITAVATVIGAVGFAAVGFVLGSWTGPGATVTTTIGAIKGASIGFQVGAAVAAGVTGVSVSALTTYGLFKSNAREKAIKECLEVATNECNKMN